MAFCYKSQYIRLSKDFINKIVPMMIHIQSASITSRTVMSSLWLKYMAYETIFLLSILQTETL